MKYFSLFCLLHLFSVTYSCSCIPLGKIDEKQYNQYDLIIKGKIIRLVEKDLSRFIYVKVDKYYKGNHNAETIIVESPIQSGMCGIFPEIGEQWLVFAIKKDNSYITNMCTRTKILNPKTWNFKKEEIEDDLKFLEKKLEETAANMGLAAIAGGRNNNQLQQNIIFSPGLTGSNEHFVVNSSSKY